MPRADPDVPAAAVAGSPVSGYSAVFAKGAPSQFWIGLILRRHVQESTPDIAIQLQASLPHAVQNHTPEQPSGAPHQ